jgi:hypothetical protein
MPGFSCQETPPAHGFADAMTKHEESREEWEQEISDVQRGVTFPDGLRRAQIISKKASATPAPIPDFAHFVRFLLSGVSLGIGFLILSSEIPHKTALGVAVLVTGCCLGIAAFRWTRKRG